MTEFIPASLPDLPYDFSALEPVINASIMELHYTKHHATYVANYNAAMEKFLQHQVKQEISEMIALEKAIKFNGGGHVNHSIFWTNLAPQNQGGGGKPEGALLTQMEKDFGGFDKFVEQMQTMTIAIQGSGWGWLGLCKKSKSLRLKTCANQDPLSTEELVPLLGIDVWEHAYYLQYQNRRADYVKGIWSIVNWQNVQERFTKTLSL